MNTICLHCETVLKTKSDGMLFCETCGQEFRMNNKRLMFIHNEMGQLLGESKLSVSDAITILINLFLGVAHNVRNEPDALERLAACVGNIAGRIRAMGVKTHM